MKRALLIRQIRNILGLKQDEFCMIFRIRADEVSKWERNVRKVPDARVFQLKYYVDKNIGKAKSDELFREVIKDIEE